jgi:hypothetical protein
MIQTAESTNRCASGIANNIKTYKMRIKKAQMGKSMAKKKAAVDSVESEMFPGKMIPKSAVRKGPYITENKKAPVKKAAVPKKKMKDGGKSFPDLNKDGEVTQKDILIGRGVLPKTAKKGVKMKKAQEGAKMKVNLRSSQLKRLGRLSAKNPDKAEKVGGRMVEKATRSARGKEYLKKNISELMPKSKYGSKMGKCRYGCK